ncbi:MAG TPA: DUF6282 family protein [Chloroflexota bacterium]|nr:DUF6282 family protein [Chloroflexota bacterium]
MTANPASEPWDPTKARYVKSYAMRRAYREEVQHPPAVPNVAGAIDLHCHAHEGQQDALDLAKHASKNGVGGILYKTIVGGQRPAETKRRLNEALRRWCDEENVEPTKIWVGWGVARGSQPISLEATRQQLDDGVDAVWMPIFNSINTLTKVGLGSQGPMPEEEAKKIGYCVVDERGNLLPEVRDIIHLLADRGVPFSFAHGSHPELDAMAEEVERIGFDRAFVDHPFSPFVDLTAEEMQRFARAGIWLNFTYDELSPLLGVDPARMYDAIRSVGPEHCTLSSDAGEPLFPNSVECMRLMRGYMRAFGLSEDEVRVVTEVNPAKVLGLLA